MSSPSKIFPYLYIGSFSNAQNKELLRDLSINYVISIGNNVKEYYPHLFDYLLFPVNDDDLEVVEIYHVFEETTKFIKKKYE